MGTLKSGRVLIADLVEMDNPEAVFTEVKTILSMISPCIDREPLNAAFFDTLRLYNGEYPSYNKCNTEYHDLKHTTDVFLALARLIHGAYLNGVEFEQNNIVLALISALLHDAGYIQKKHDTEGTGAKYTAVHVTRSVDFATAYLTKKGFASNAAASCGQMIYCTALSKRGQDISFVSPDIEQLGKMLGTADLIGQLADRVYLEKLLFLYREFAECSFRDYESEFDLLSKTLGFYEICRERLSEQLDNMTKHLSHHFLYRWKIGRNMYEDAIENNFQFLKYLLQHHTNDYRDRLKRGGIVARLNSKSRT